MTLYIPLLSPLLKKTQRRGSHKSFIFNRIYEIHNMLVGLLFSINTDTPIKVIRKTPTRRGEKSNYIICKISEEDLHLLTESKSKLKLVKKYRRRLNLLNI